MIRLFESINKTTIPNKSILKEEIDTLRDSNLEASVALGENVNKKKVMAKDLKAGDHIVGLGKGFKVVRGAQAGINTPSGKIDIVVEYPNGQKQLKIWNKNTMIQIYDSPTT